MLKLLDGARTVTRSHESARAGGLLVILVFRRDFMHLVNEVCGFKRLGKD